MEAGLKRSLARPWQNISFNQWSPDGRYIASVSSNGYALEVWQTMTGKVVATFPNLTVEIVMWSPESRRLVVVVPGQGQLQIWDALSGKQLMTFSDDSKNPGWSADGTCIISWGRNAIRVWDVSTGHIVLTLPVVPGAWNSNAVSCDGRYIALSNATNEVQVWETATGHKVFIYHGYAAGVTVQGTGWSPDNRHVGTVGNDGKLLVWDAFTGQTLSFATVDIQAANGVGWSPDGKLVTVTNYSATFEVLQVG